MTTAEQHKLVNGLLEFANLLIEVGSFPAELQWRPTFYFTAKPEDREEITRLLAPVKKVYRDGYLSLEKEFSKFWLQVGFGDRVCTAKATKQVWVAEKPPQEAVPGYYMEEVEWECPQTSILTERSPDAGPETV